jgi:transposase
MVELVRAGRDPEELAREFEPTSQSIRNWVAQSDRDEGKREDGLTTAEHEELRRLRRENRQLREEREILKKAAVWFARESESNGRKPRIRKGEPGHARSTDDVSAAGSLPQRFLRPTQPSTVEEGEDG